MQSIQCVKETWGEEGILHPSIVNKLMKTSAGIGSSRFGWMTKGFQESPDGKGLSDFPDKIFNQGDYKRGEVLGKYLQTHYYFPLHCR